MNVKASVQMLDGKAHEVEGLYIALPDRIAFERRFKIPVLTLTKDEALLEEHVAFLVHRLLLRSGVDVGTFDAFVENVQEITLEAIPVPTEPTAP